MDVEIEATKWSKGGFREEGSECEMARGSARKTLVGGRDLYSSSFISCPLSIHAMTAF
jgi:hypothetical protein